MNEHRYLCSTKFSTKHMNCCDSNFFIFHLIFKSSRILYIIQKIMKDVFKIMPMSYWLIFCILEPEKIE